MVLFININVGQRVEVLHRGHISTGTVKYKGCLNGIVGDWVGVALDRPYGKHDGMLRGRRYFQCPTNHGIFTTAAKIRFMPTKRCLYNRYRTVEPESLVEEDLFGLDVPDVSNGLHDPICIEQRYSYQATAQDFPGSRLSSYYSPPPTHSLRHSISNSVPATSMLRPETSRGFYTYRSLPLHSEFDYDDPYDDFISAPSIPKTHMPHAALRKQVDRGWDHDHYVREMSVHTGRHSIKLNSWNDI